MENGQKKKATRGHIYEHITAVGNWGSVPLEGLKKLTENMSPQGEKKMGYVSTIDFMLLAKGCFWGDNSVALPTSTVCYPGLLWARRALSVESQALATGNCWPFQKQ